MHRVVVVAVVVLGVLWSLPSSSSAIPTITQDLAFTENRPADDIFGITGLRLQLDVTATDPGGSGALTGAGAKAQATSSNATFPFSQPVTIPFNSFFGLQGVEFTTNLLLPGGAADFSKITGTYNFTVTNTSNQSTSDTSHNLDKPEVIPIPTGLHTNNLSTTPVFSFTDPNPTPGITDLVRRYDFFVHDGITDNVIFAFGVSTNSFSTVPSFAVPAGLLLPGHPYFFRALSIDVDTTEPVTTLHPRIENRANEYLSFTPVPEPGSLFLLASGLAVLTGAAWRARHRS
jgi:hypothetical protein